MAHFTDKQRKELIVHLIFPAEITFAQHWKVLHTLRVEMWINKAFPTATLENITNKVKIKKHQRQETQFIKFGWILYFI